MGLPDGNKGPAPNRLFHLLFLLFTKLHPHDPNGISGFNAALMGGSVSGRREWSVRFQSAGSDRAMYCHKLSNIT
jgi:hypothetical protein